MLTAGELPINEKFVSFQGEGPYAGRRCGFVRLGHCNLHCPPCDSKPTWDTSQYDLDETCPPTQIVTVKNWLYNNRLNLVVITGGEPLIWQAKPDFARLYSFGKIKAHIETNGTIIPAVRVMEGVEHFSVSPKLSAMGGADPLHRRIKPKAIEVFRELAESNRACFKFVVDSPETFEEARVFARDYGLDPASVWIMAEGTDTETLLERQRKLAPLVLRSRFNFSTRLHILNRQR